MPRCCIIGAGNIGRGFLAPLFAQAGWDLVFIDADPVRVQALGRPEGYRVLEADAQGQRALRMQAQAAWQPGPQAEAALAQADVIATSVGLAALATVGRMLGRALKQRTSPVDILLCENGASACQRLQEGLHAEMPADWPRRVGLVRTSIGRMIPPPPPGADSLDIVVEPYATLPLDAAALTTSVLAAVPGIVPVSPFNLALDRKRFLHNGTHAALAYAGRQRGHHLLKDCCADRELRALVRQAGEEICQALAKAYAAPGAERAALLRSLHAERDELLERYANPVLGDTVARVGRDPFRKLALDDRLLGAVLLCQEQQVSCPALARCILDACAWRASSDEPRAAQWNALAAQGYRAVLEEACALKPGSYLDKLLTVAQRQRTAAARMRAAGLVLHAQEEANIEIADFGLGDYAATGLAIHVYVNTARCCAKELAMEPHQMCPEHRHPSVHGEPGKEETFRVRSGEVFLFLPGDESPAAQACALPLLPPGKEQAVTVYRCVHLLPGDQCTLPPDTKHWFVAGAQGAVVSEFSTRSRDDADIFTDSAIIRTPELGPHVG